LGTNGWYDTPTGNTVCTLISSQEYHVIFDAGYGLYKADRYIEDLDDRPVYLFLSHFHVDHIAGLHTLNKFRFPGGLVIGGPEGSRDILKIFLNNPFTAPLQDLPYKAGTIELPSEQDQVPFPVTVKPLRHTALTLGYRIVLDGRTITYCPDTGYCANAVELSAEADLLIAECAYKSGQFNEAWPHLNPETAARIAKEARARKMALIHFDARTHPTLEDRADSENAAKRIFPDTFATIDDMMIRL
jgi:ribonuclease BN (tRNA processing enzyme)